MSATRAARRRQTKLDSKSPWAGSVPADPRPLPDVRADDVLAIARVLEPAERMAFFAILDGKDEPYLTFEQWVDRAHPGYLWGRHLCVLARRLQDLCDGLLARLMVFMPPRHGKSELISKLFTAYYLYRHSKRDVAVTTYGAELSYDLSRSARTNYLDMGCQLAPDSRAIKSWHTIDGGNLWATGVGGPATGRGFHLGVIDDPFKDAAEAQSEVIRRTRLAWYKSVFRTRAAPGAAIIVLMTRWHEDDLAGRLLAEEEASQERWHVIEMPAEKRRAPMLTSTIAPELSAVSGNVQELPATKAAAYTWPSTVTIEPDVRDDETWLWTQRFPASEYEAQKRVQGGEGGYFWNALFQQRPVPAEGDTFKREWFKKIRRALLPSLQYICRWWDLAATENDGAFTAGLKVARGHDGNYYILGLEHVQYGAGKRDNLMEEVTKIDGVECTVLVPQDPGAAGKQVAQAHITRLEKHAPVYKRKESGDKDARAQLPASAASNGFYFIVDEPWAEIVLRELTAFGPGAQFRDVADALSGAHAWLAEKARDRRPTQGTVSMRSIRQ
jgi:predicted phage terminase large subunit-like protein